MAQHRGILRASHLTVGYRRHPVVTGVDLEVAPGRITTLIGPNGAGKSTILKTLTGEFPAIEGEVWLGDVPLASVPAKARAQTIAVLTTERARPELMTCFDVVSAGRYPYTGNLGILSADDRQAVDAAMELVGVRSLADADFTRVSDGQRQLVLLARAICQEPDVLILDEPTSFLDIRHKLLLLAILKDLVNDRSIGVLTSLHELDLAQRASDWVLCVREGAIDRAGTPDEIFVGDYVNELFAVEQGGYNVAFGAPELAAPTGEARLFVIGGGGSALDLYRHLQRLGMPFSVGVLDEADVDMPAARALAREVISVPAFSPIDDAAFERAVEAIDRCAAVLCPLESFGPFNERNRRLRDYAQIKGVLAASLEDALAGMCSGSCHRGRRMCSGSCPRGRQMCSGDAPDCTSGFFRATGSASLQLCSADVQSGASPLHIEHSCSENEPVAQRKPDVQLGASPLHIEQATFLSDR